MHFAYYLKEWKNLYRYSQQGWESLNSLIKSFYFHRTQRGGHGATVRLQTIDDMSDVVLNSDDFEDGFKSHKSRAKSIAKWLQRRLIWLSYDR